MPCAGAVLPNTDPIHKVTILPRGMALGVTQYLPAEERHSYNQDYLEESIAVAMGGRIAEELVFGVVSTGANNDLVVATERARKMVREWGMSTRIGPMAWGSQNQVFLGDDLMHSRDYSDDTARVIDEEVERILREQEQHCREVLTEHRKGLDLVARALLEYETIEGSEVTRLIELANNGVPVRATEHPLGDPGAPANGSTTPSASASPGPAEVNGGPSDGNGHPSGLTPAPTRPDWPPTEIS